jgi:hypothetical protein
VEKAVDNVTRAPVVSFGPSRALSSGCLVAGVIVAGLAAFGTDSDGRFLVGLAALLLLALGGYDAVVTPRLTASARGLQIRTLGARTALTWADVQDIRFDERTRLGLASRTLEIDGEAVLVVLGRHSLGCEPRDAFDLISAFRP